MRTVFEHSAKSGDSQLPNACFLLMNEREKHLKTIKKQLKIIHITQSHSTLQSFLSVSLCLCLPVSESIFVSIYLCVSSSALLLHKTFLNKFNPVVDKYGREKVCRVNFLFIFAFFFTHHSECTVNLWLPFFLHSFIYM